MGQILCPIRNQWVAATPEEKVRQHLILLMIRELGFPKGLIAVEKNLLPGFRFPGDRRPDLICYAAAKEGVIPLLIAECKADELNEAAERQVFGYNSAIKAPFLCLANRSEIRTLWQEAGRIGSVPFLPSYTQLMGKLCL